MKPEQKRSRELAARRRSCSQGEVAEDDAERRRLKGRREITHGLVKDYVWLSLFTSPAMGARGLSITEGEKDMDLLINDKLHVDFSHEGECDPVHLTCRPCGRGRAL